MILGAGRMGRVIAYAMNKFEFDVVAVDTSESAINYIRDTHPSAAGIVTSNIAQELESIIKNSRYTPDVVISSLPYFVNKDVADTVIKRGIPYCDLGGRVDVSASINEAAESLRAERPVFTDLGLAPGWVNILAEHGYRSLHGPGSSVDTSVEMMVGGLPDWLESSKNILRYGCTWSMEGLVNEYKDDCIILKDGKEVVVAGLDGLEWVESDNLG